jgi:hypothetical protein
MILFRVRRYGQADWTEVSIRNSLGDDDSEVEEEIGKLIESVLVVDDMHCQSLNAEGEWEDLE